MRGSAAITKGAGALSPEAFEMRERMDLIAVRARQLRATYPRPPMANHELKELQKEHEDLRKKLYGR